MENMKRCFATVSFHLARTAHMTSFLYVSPLLGELQNPGTALKQINTFCVRRLLFIEEWSAHS